jgi:membrane protein YdbS with pleckstrin-like domain
MLNGTYHWFSDKAKFYALREQDISYFSGLFFKKLVTQPASRIQHVEVSQGPIDRIAGLAKLQVYSAGSGMQTFGIPGLPQELAHQLRQSLTEKIVSDSEAPSEEASLESAE